MTSHGTTGPSLAPLTPLMDACVHCGFCLPTCPSYLLSGLETESPRGRIYLMRGLATDRAALTPNVVHHFDTCLGCMACETACPSGVRYAPLIEHTRDAIEQEHSRPLGERLFRRLLFAVLPYPRRLAMIAKGLPFARFLQRRPALLAALPARVRSLVALAPATSSARVTLPEVTSPGSPPRLRVGLVTGCVQSVFFQEVNRASVRVLAAEGCEVVTPRAQGCCGALALHAGHADEARAFARDLISRFESTGVDQIVVNAAGCGSTIKTYAALLADDAAWAERARAFTGRVRDITETLAELLPARAPRHTLPLRVAYHDACHLAHAQGVRRQPRELLASIPGVTTIPLADSDICCGSAGLFNLMQPEMAATLGQRKEARIADAAPDLVVTANPGCILQLRAAARGAGHDRQVCHIVELLDRAITGTPS